MSNGSESLALVRHSDVSIILPRSFAEAQLMSVELFKSTMIAPQRKNPADVLALIMSGAELGLPPMAAMRLQYLRPDGQAGLTADGFAAVVLSHPLCELLEPVEETTTYAIWKTKRVGRPERSYKFTIEDAARAGLVKEGSNWKKYPQRMCSARCKSLLVRDVFPDVVGGIPAEDEGDDTRATGFVAPPVERVDAAIAAATVATETTTAPKRSKKAEQAAADAAKIAEAPKPEPVVEVVKEAPAAAKEAAPPPFEDAEIVEEEGGFGEPDRPAPGVPAKLVEFRAAIAAATDKATMKKIRTTYAPWSREPEGVGFANAMREEWSKRDAEIPG